MWGFINKIFKRNPVIDIDIKPVTDKELLKAVVSYVRGPVDMDVLNKVSETITTVAMREKGRLDPMKEEVLNKALDCWSKGEPTPKEFSSLFRGGR